MATRSPNMYKKLFRTLASLTFLGALIVPTFVLAAAYHIDCTNFPTEGGSTGDVGCTASTISFTAASFAYIWNTVSGNQFPAGTYYLSWTSTTSGGDGAVNIGGDVTGSTQVTFGTGTYTDQVMVVPAGNTYSAVTFFNETAGGPPRFAGSITDICWSNSAGECFPAPPPTPTSTEATSTPDQVQQNFANAVGLLIAGMFFSIYLFKKNN